jgi:DNA-binding transcriptional LysR family regulator
MKNINGLVAFVESARLGSLTAAAIKLDLTPAAISKSVIRLEAELGVRLFNRNTRRLRLTSEGTLFLARAAEILRDLDAAVAEVSQTTEAVKGLVKISVGAFFGRRWVLPVLPTLLAQHPGLEIEVDLDNRQIDLVAEGFDIGIRGGVVHDSSLIARRICALPVVLATSTIYIAKRGYPSTVDDLAAHDLIALRFSNHDTPAWQFLDGDKTLDYAPGARLWVSEPEALLDLVIAGCGIAQIGLHHVVAHLRAGTLKLVLTQQHFPGHREIMLHYPHRQYLAPRVRATVDHVLAALAAATDLHLTAKDTAYFDAASMTGATQARSAGGL